MSKEDTTPIKWAKCKYPGCGGRTEPPNVYCSWMCEVDFNRLHAQEPFKIQLRKEHGYSCTCGCQEACRCPECDKLYGKSRGRV